MKELLSAAAIPGISGTYRVDRVLLHALLNLGKALSSQLPLEQFTAALAERSYGDEEPVYTLLLIELRCWDRRGGGPPPIPDSTHLAGGSFGRHSAF